MIIIFSDGSTLKCSEIEFTSDGKKIIVDEYRIIPFTDIIRIILD